MDDVAAVRRARRAVALLFFVNGFVIGTWAAHIPLVEERLAISHSTLGIALLAMAFGGLLAMPLAGPMIARFGSALVTRGATAILLIAFLLPILAPTPGLLMLALFLFGAANGIMDVAINAHGVAVERSLGRPLMSSFHGMWSLGGLVGSGFAALLLPSMPSFTQVASSVVVGGALSVAGLIFLLPASADRRSRGNAFAWPNRAALGLGALCFLSLMSEGAIVDWAALHLKAGFELSAGLAATGFTAFSALMALSRFSGDWLRSRFGAKELVRWSAVLSAAGLVVAIAAPVPLLAIGGFALVGLGLGNLIPVLFGAAGRIPGPSPGISIAAVATFGYSGFVVGPPLIGFVADATSLAQALVLVVFACLAIALSASVVMRSSAAVTPTRD